MAEPSASQGANRPRYMGKQDGKHVWFSTATGGVLDYMADLEDIESATVLAGLVRTILEADQPAEDAELAVFVPLLTEALERAVKVAAKLADSRGAVYGEGAVKVGEAIRASMTRKPF